MGAKLSQGINPDKLDQLIRDLGVRVRVYKSTLCPNMKSLESMDHDINCPVCNNNMIDFCPKETIAMFQQQGLVEQYKLQGTFNMDEVTVSFLSGVTLAPLAKVELLDFKEDFYELVQKQVQADTDTDLLKYAACEVLGVFVIRAGVAKQFYQGPDFELDVNGSVKWLTANRPNDKEIYSIYYRFHPIYRAVKALHRDRFTQWNTRPDDITSPKTTVDGATYVKLPEEWILKRDYLLERRDQDGDKLPENQDYDPNA
jgi:hypothetical protein